ncbi:Crp/Fnr family transcriptional regulator [Thalassotalea sediminis]|uniref:Crp/Fnr family transcriptional regulator n=1 Tax=Thalassotalea sediminis TaxID=1759089 RepID=UPI0025729770|nr:Crp/Fnr family transcriptional regulator [Thalassotalea sediminis]
MLTKTLAFQKLRQTINAYYPISEETWQTFVTFCQFQQVNAGHVLYPLGEIPTSFAFIYQGLMRGFSANEKGQEYNKIFFSEDMFPGSMTALLTHSPAKLAIDAIENTTLIRIDFAKFREFLIINHEIKLFHINYLEKNWLLAKDEREIEIVQQDAATRYQKFITQFPILSQRLPQYHIASHLGITPTQLSRIRKIKTQ